MRTASLQSSQHTATISRLSFQKCLLYPLLLISNTNMCFKEQLWGPGIRKRCSCLFFYCPFPLFGVTIHPAFRLVVIAAIVWHIALWSPASPQLWCDCSLELNIGELKMLSSVSLRSHICTNVVGFSPESLLLSTLLGHIPQLLQVQPWYRSWSLYW